MENDRIPAGGLDIWGKVKDKTKRGTIFADKKLKDRIVQGWHPTRRKENDDLMKAGDIAKLGEGENVCALLIGRRGQGKTALMTGLVKTMIKKYVDEKFAARVYSNYKIRFLRRDARGRAVDYYSATLVDEIGSFPPWLQRGYMVLDEIQSFAASRRSLSRSNITMSLFLTQMRHRDIETLWTTQFPQVLDYQALLQVDMFVRCHTIERHPPNRQGKRFPKVMQLELYDYWGLWTGRDYRKRWPPQREDMDDVRIVQLPLSLAGTYDTREIIASTYYDSTTRAQIIDEENYRQGEAEWDAAVAASAQTAQAHYETEGRQRYTREALLSVIPKGGPPLRFDRLRTAVQQLDPTVRDDQDIAAVLLDLAPPGEIEITSYPDRRGRQVFEVSRPA